MGKTFAENLILARSKTGMTQKELARKSGLSTQQLAGYEVGDSGSISSPPLTHVIKLASVLGISIDDLVPIHKFNAEPSLANLIAEIDRLKSDLRESEDLVEHLQDKRTELQREVETLRKDAERYRWLRQDDLVQFQISKTHSEEAMDRAIDAAMDKEPDNG